MPEVAKARQADASGQACRSGLDSECLQAPTDCQGSQCECVGRWIVISHCVGGWIVISQDDCTFTTEGADIPFDLVLQ